LPRICSPTGGAIRPRGGHMAKQGLPVNGVTGMSAAEIVELGEE